MDIETNGYSDWGRINVSILDGEELKHQRIRFCIFYCIFARKLAFLSQKVQNPQFEKSQNRQKIDFPEMGPKYIPTSKYCKKWLFNAQRPFFYPYSIFSYTLNLLLKFMIFVKNTIFCHFSTKFILRKLPFWLQKGIKNLKNFFEPKSMDHKLSNDVFGMLKRFLVWILW